MGTRRFPGGRAVGGLVLALLSVAGGPLAQAQDRMGRTAAEWLRAVETQATVEKGAWDAAWRDVMRGAALALPPLSTVSHEFRKMGAEATRLALRIIDGELSPAAAARTVSLVPARFVARHSTGPPPSHTT